MITIVLKAPSEQTEKHLNDLLNKINFPEEVKVTYVNNCELGADSKVVVVMGNEALFALTGYKAITNHRGKFIEKEFTIFPTFNPIIEEKHKLILEDLKYLKAYLYPVESKIKRIEVDSIEKFNDMCNLICRKRKAACDIETTGLRSHVDKIIGIGFSMERDTGYYIPLYIKAEDDYENPIIVDDTIKLMPLWSEDELEFIRSGLKKVLENSNNWFFGQGFWFDRRMIKADLDIFVKNICYDTLSAAHLINENIKHDLGTITSRYEDMIGHKHELTNELSKTKIKSGNYAEAKRETIVKYGCDDVIGTNRYASDSYKESIKGTKLEPLLFNILIPFMDVQYQMETHGTKVDIEYLQQLKIDFTDKIDELDQTMFSMVDMKFNPNSTDELRYILFNNLKLDKNKSKESKKTGKLSTDAHVLKRLMNDHPFIKILLERRSVHTMLTRYIANVEKRLVNGIIYPTFNSAGPVTGRLSSSNPNMQNFSKAKEDEYGIGLEKYNSKIRPMFIPREGNSFIDNDFSQMELRLLAWYSQDETMLNAFHNGEDVHLAMAKVIFGKQNISDDERRKAKTINFGIIYGISDYGLAQQLEIEPKEAHNLIVSHYNKFPRVKHFKDEVFLHLKEYEFVEHAYGRRRRFPGYNSLPDFVKPKNSMYSKPNPKKEAMKREAFNFFMQGLTAETVKESAIRIYKELKELIQNAQIHDEILGETAYDIAYEVSKKSVEIMERPYSNIDVPLVVNSEIQSRWGVSI